MDGFFALPTQRQFRSAFSALQEASNAKSLNADFVIIVWESSLHGVVSAGLMSRCDTTRDWYNHRAARCEITYTAVTDV